jgi:hypothetical protein
VGSDYDDPSGPTGRVSDDVGQIPIQRNERSAFEHRRYD